MLFASPKMPPLAARIHHTHGNGRLAGLDQRRGNLIAPESHAALGMPHFDAVEIGEIVVVYGRKRERQLLTAQPAGISTSLRTHIKPLNPSRP